MSSGITVFLLSLSDDISDRKVRRHSSNTGPQFTNPGPRQEFLLITAH